MAESKEVYNGHGIRVTLETGVFPNGKTRTIARAHRADAVHIAAFTSTGNVLILREYRPFYQGYIWMLPSGHVDKETDHLVAAQRELREETGFRAKHLQYWGISQVAERIVSKNVFYVAHELTKDPLPQDDDEMIEVFEKPLEEALKLVQESSVTHLPSECLLLKILHKFPTGFPQS